MTIIIETDKQQDFQKYIHVYTCTHILNMECTYCTCTHVYIIIYTCTYILVGLSERFVSWNANCLQTLLACVNVGCGCAGVGVGVGGCECGCECVGVGEKLHIHVRNKNMSMCDVCV